MFWIFYFILFLVGVAIGSFLNVVIWRYQPTGKIFNLSNLIGRSRCPYCQQTLRWFELIPLLSFLLQRGRCRSCSHLLSWQYPLVELASGLIFIFLPFYLSNFYHQPVQQFVFFQSPHWYYGLILVWVLVFLVWLIITVIDWRYFVVPDELNGLLAVLGIVICLILVFNQNVLWPFQNSFLRHYSLVFSPFGDQVVFNRLLGAAGAAGFFALFYWLSRGRAIGFGDVKLSAALGLVLGWPDVGLAIIIAFIIGGFWGILAILSHKKTMRDRLPFAPFLGLGSVITVFFGYQIINFYFSLFGII